MKNFNAMLVLLISSISITGISFVDGRIWDIAFLIVGMLAYTIVGVMLSIGLISGKQAGREAYRVVFGALILAAYGVYRLLEKMRIWILGWPLYFKIIVIVLLCLSFIVVIARKALYIKYNEPVSDYFE